MSFISIGLGKVVIHKDAKNAVSIVTKKEIKALENTNA